MSPTKKKWKEKVVLFAYNVHKWIWREFYTTVYTNNIFIRVQNQPTIITRTILVDPFNPSIPLRKSLFRPTFPSFLWPTPLTFSLVSFFILTNTNHQTMIESREWEVCWNGPQTAYFIRVPTSKKKKSFIIVLLFGRTNTQQYRVLVSFRVCLWLLVLFFWMMIFSHRKSDRDETVPVLL